MLQGFLELDAEPLPRVKRMQHRAVIILPVTARKVNCVTFGTLLYADISRKINVALAINVHFSIPEPVRLRPPATERSRAGEVQLLPPDVIRQVRVKRIRGIKRTRGIRKTKEQLQSQYHQIYWKLQDTILVSYLLQVACRVIKRTATFISKRST